MIIASSDPDRDRVHTASATVEPRTLRRGLTPPEPPPRWPSASATPPLGSHSTRHPSAGATPRLGTHSIRQSLADAAPRLGAYALRRHPLKRPRYPRAQILREFRAQTLHELRAQSVPRPGLEILVPLLLLALAVTAFLPWTRLELRTTADQVAVETAATLISTLAALLFFDRFWHHLRRRDLLLASGLAVIAASNLGAGLLLANDVVLAGHSAAWVVIAGRIAGWLLIAAAALTHDRLITRPRREVTHIALRYAAGLAIATVLGVLLSADSVSSEVAHSGPLGNQTAMLVVQILLVVLTSAAALTFIREAHHDGSPTARLLALACAFAATAALANCAMPSFYASRVGVGDLLRLGWLVTLFACVCVEWSLDERRAPARALARERRRMAADVHDLIMQDLSFALANARTLADDPARSSQASTVVSAGERALAGARDVVSGLTEHDARPIPQAVEASVRAAARHTPLTFHAPSTAPATGPELDRPTRDALVHIAREAVTNAVKHARPSAIEVVLEHTGQWRLTVRDDGSGFDETPTNPGFGLLSMRQSAHALGGAVHVGSATGQGTTVEAVIP
jgi:signal transduction histidine kinase